MKLLKFLLVAVVSIGMIMLTLQFFRNNDTLSLIFKTMSVTQSAVDNAAGKASQAAADTLTKAQSGLQSAGGVKLTVTSQQGTQADAHTQSAASLPKDGNVWGSTGMQGLKVYEYGKTLLDAEQQGIYDAIVRAVENMDGSFSVKTAMKPAEIETVYQYVIYDHSEVFYLKDSNLQYSYTGSGSNTAYQSYTFQFSYRYDKATVSGMRGQMQAAAAKLLQTATGSSDIEKERQLHDALVRSVSYDNGAAQNPDSSPQSFTAYGAFVNKKAVCDGYARATKILFSSAGIRTLYLTGTAKGGGDWESHGWNMAEIGGKWFYVDTTFDDPLYINRNGAVVSTQDSVSHKYFNFISKDDHKLSLFSSSDPFSADSGNYAQMPPAG